MTATTPVIFRFEGFELDSAMAELRANGQPVPVEPQVFDLIRLLVEGADRVVTRDEIIQQVWQGRIVSESAIASRINAARRALGDDGKDQRVIRTVHGRGFRLVLTPEVAGQSAVAHAFGAKPSIVVLPFTVLSDAPEQEFFADGIAEDIIAALSRFHQLSVIARNTSFTYRGQSVSTAQIAEELGVKYALEGSLRQAGNRVRVSVALIDAAADRTLWSERYDRDLDDVFEVQDEITTAAVSAIAPHTDRAEMAAATAKDPTSLSDWEQVMRARWHLGKFSRQDTDAALRLLTEAVAHAPDVAIAHSTIAHARFHRMLNYWAPSPLEEITAAAAAAERAVALDHFNADAHAILGLAALFRRDFETCFEHLDEAISQNPNLANAYGFIATARGCQARLDDAQTAIARATALSPRDPARVFWISGMGIGLFLNAHYEDCVENAERAFRIQPRYGPALRQKAAALQMLGETDAAQAVIAEIQRAMPGLTVSAVARMVPVAGAADNEHWLGALRAAGLPD